MVMAVNQHTAAAVHRQLWSLNCESYEVAIMRERDGRSVKQTAGFTMLAGAGIMLPDLCRQNAKGENVFVRPDPRLDRALVLVDDIEEIGVDTLRDAGLEPCCVVETSLKNLQCWLDFGGIMAPMERKLIARRLAEMVDGDLGSADGVHYGRLAGFTNRKPSHLGEGRNGGFPFVLCRFAARLICSRSDEMRQWAQEQAQQAARATKQKNAIVYASKSETRLKNDFRRYSDYWMQNPDHARRQDGTDDLSMRDYAVVCRLLREGGDPEIILQVLADDATRKSDPQEYAKRTVEAALSRG